ncbi:MAG: prephenate dehydrogenase [Gammaproteobacteria bacterium]|nr:prephenate dehydrogenase [Gammaproteobacteria bacterium]
MNKPHLPAISAVVLGGNGALGSLFCAKFAGGGIATTSIDVAPAPSSRLRNVACIVSDVRTLSEEAKRVLSGADWVVAALPEGVLLETWQAIVSLMKQGALFADTLSVKLPLATAMAGRMPRTIEQLSINPMFAPSLDFVNQSVAVVEASRGVHADRFLRLMQQWGATLHMLSAEQHDRCAAALQTATHAAILAFGLAMRRLDYDVEAMLPVMTPPHRALLSLLARILSASPEVYWDIQTHNTFAADARQSLAEGLRELTAAIEGGDQDRFRRLLADLQAMLGKERLAELNEYSTRMFRCGDK